MTDDQTGIAQKLDELTRYARELVSYVRRNELADALDKPEKIAAYRLSNGHRSSRAVKEEGELSVSKRTIRNWWDNWVEKGLADRTDGGQARSRYDPFVLKAEVFDDE